MKVWVVTVHAPYSGGWVDSLWATEELAKTARDRAIQQHRGSDIEIEEFGVGEA